MAKTPENRKAVKKLILSIEEKVVRSYKCSKMRLPRSTGYVTVTNKKLIFHGEGKDTQIMNSVLINSISGLSCYNGKKFSPLRLGLGIILTPGVLLGMIGLMISIEGMGNSRYSWFSAGSVVIGIVLLLLGGLVGAAGIYFLATSFRKAFFLKVFAPSASDSPITVGKMNTTIFGGTASFSLWAEPTDETEQMINELGALIDDLQLLGDMAISRWNGGAQPTTNNNQGATATVGSQNPAPPVGTASPNNATIKSKYFDGVWNKAIWDLIPVDERVQFFAELSEADRRSIFAEMRKVLLAYDANFKKIESKIPIDYQNMKILYRSAPSDPSNIGTYYPDPLIKMGDAAFMMGLLNTTPYTMQGVIYIIYVFEEWVTRMMEITKEG